MKKSIQLIYLLFILLLLANCRINKDKAYENNIEKHTLLWEDLERKYYIYVPSIAKSKTNIALLFSLHGGGGTAKGSLKQTKGRYNELADKDGFIVVYPQAIKRHWNSGRTSKTLKKSNENIDDVGFLDEIVKVISEKYKVDTSKIFITGMSNGGFMTSRILCEKPDVFRGGAILTATISDEYFHKCNPLQPTAVLIMNGTEDPIVPYDGGQITLFGKDRGKIISTDKLVKFWKEKNGCITKKEEINLPNTKDDGTTVTIQEYTDCSQKGSLILYKINGGGHTIPSGKRFFGEKLVGKSSYEIVACDVIWEYFDNL